LDTRGFLRPMCDRIVERAAEYHETARELVVPGEGVRLILGRTYGFRPNALPLGVWMQRQIEQVLREHDLWCEDATLSLDSLYEADWEDGDDHPSWPVDSRFVVWADRPLFSGSATGTARQVAPPPPGYDHDDAYLEVDRLTVKIDGTGDRAALPPTMETFLDEEPVADGGNAGCYLAIVVLAAVAILTVVGLITTVSWVISRF